MEKGVLSAVAMIALFSGSLGCAPGAASDAPNRTRFKATWPDPDRPRVTLSWEFPATGGIVVRPGAEIELSIIPPQPQNAAADSMVRLEGEWDASRASVADKSLAIFAPRKPGVYRVAHSYKIGAETVTDRFTLFVALRAEVAGGGKFGEVSVEGEKLGTYYTPQRAVREKVRRHADAYGVPEWFIRFDEADSGVRLTPTYTLGDLYPREARNEPPREHPEPPSLHLALDYNMLLKLEALTEELRDLKLLKGKLALTSAYRSPIYNASIESGHYSRHMYGDAVDFAIDEDSDPRQYMDDVDGDGRVDRRDLILIARVVRRLEAAGRVREGGCGIYERRSGGKSIDGYIHMDARGHHATWGYTVDVKTEKADGDITWERERPDA